MLPFAPPPIQGFSAFGGFQFEVLDQSGENIANLEQAAQGMIREGTKAGRLTGMFSAFRASDPQLLIEIDRARARAEGVPIREITDALQVFLGSQYVNDFDFNDRAYRVYVQADQAFRSEPDDLGRLYARSAAGNVVPLSALVWTREVTSPQVISHFNQSAQLLIHDRQQFPGGPVIPLLHTFEKVGDVTRAPRATVVPLQQVVATT